jgi:hypothetical protein
MHLSKFINFDGGSFWYERSLQFYKSISEGDFEGTFLSRHPGVTVMILSGGSIISATLIKYGTVHSWKHRNVLYPYAKLPVVLITGLGIIFIYFLLQKKYSQSAFPLLAAIFLALDPNFLAHSRYFHLDAIVSIFMVLSLLTFFAYLTVKGKKYLVISGMFAGLSILTKISALALLPFMALVWLIYRFRNIQDNIIHGIKEAAIFGIIVISVIFILFPAMWVSPKAVVPRIFFGIKNAAVYTHENTGSLKDDIKNTGEEVKRGVKFDPALIKSFVKKSSTITLILAFFGIVGILLNFYRNKNDHLNQLMLFLFSFYVYFLLGLSFFSKAVTIDNAIRYVLVCFIIFDLLAAYGIFVLMFSFKWKKNVDKKTDMLRNSFAGLLVLIYAINVFSLHPYYQTFSNGFLKADNSGWGEGLEIVAEYLNKKENASDLVVASFWSSIFKKFFKGNTLSLKLLGNETPDYIVLYRLQVQRYFFPEIVDNYYLNKAIQPEFTAKINDIEYAWLYKYSKAANNKIGTSK